MAPRMTGHCAMHRTLAMSRAWLLLLGLWVVLGASTARAQSAQETALARKLFEEGVTLADHGDWQGAADRFGRAFALKPTSGIAFNYASALVEVGRIVEACELLRSVTRDATASAPLRSEAEAKLAQVSPRIGYLTVRVEGDPGPDGRVDVDGTDWPRAAWGVASPVDPGTHMVRLSRGELEISREEVSLGDGERRELSLSAGAAPELPVGPVVTDTTDGHMDSAAGGHGQTGDGGSERRPFYKSWVLWTAVGAVIVGAVVAGVLLGSPKDKKSEAPVSGDTTPAVIRW